MMDLIKPYGGEDFEAVVLSGSNFAYQGTLAMMEDIFGCHIVW
jgi:hypothetical protein